MLLGIVLHATLPYFARIAGIEAMWPADDDQSLALLVLFDFIHLWRMPVFFLLAGFFAHLVLERRSTGAFMRDRLRRIAVPLVLFTAVMALLLPALWNYGWKGAFVVDPGVLDPRKWPYFASLDTPLAHLWFLWHLLLMYAVLLALRRAGATRFCSAARALPPLDSLRRHAAAAVYARPPLLLIAVAVILLAVRGGDESKPIFPPNVPDLLYGAIFFFYGYGLWARRALIEDLKRHGRLAVLWASAGAAYALHLVMLGALQEADGGGASGLLAPLAMVEVLASGSAVVLLALALMGSCEALFTAPRRWGALDGRRLLLDLPDAPAGGGMAHLLARAPRPVRTPHRADRVRLGRRTEIPGRQHRHRGRGSGDLPIPRPLHPARHAPERQPKPGLRRPRRYVAFATVRR